MAECVADARLIPAWAGKTAYLPVFNCPDMAHPRVGGENFLVVAFVFCKAGSSPRGRGKLAWRLGGVWRGGLIPAWAGKTT